MRMQVNLQSGRVLFGDLQCLDKDGNLILGNSIEQLQQLPGEKTERVLGMVLVPKSQMATVHLLVSGPEPGNM